MIGRLKKGLSNSYLAILILNLDVFITGCVFYKKHTVQPRFFLTLSQIQPKMFLFLKNKYLFRCYLEWWINARNQLFLIPPVNWTRNVNMQITCMTLI